MADPQKPETPPEPGAEPADPSNQTGVQDEDVKRPGTANVARLKREIESGAQRDKVSYPDPGASPLGTDDEAAGRPADAERERIELSSRTAVAGEEKPFEKLQSAPRADPGDAPSPRVETTPRFRLAVFGGAALIIAAAAILALLT